MQGSAGMVWCLGRVATAVEEWELEMANLKSEWPEDFTMSDAMKKTAIMFMLPAKAKEKIEDDLDQEEVTYSQIREAVMKRAVRKRLEGADDKMDIGEAEGFGEEEEKEDGPTGEEE